MEEILIFIEKCLKKFEYPNIYGSDIAEILGDTNRTFLLSWLYKLIQCEDSPEELSKETISNFLSTYGFCSNSQLKGFIEMTLDYPSQCKILYRIFKMLDTVRKEFNSCENTEELSLEMIGDFVCTDVNMFKCYGQLKICENVSEKEVNCDLKNELKNMNEEYDNLRNLSQMKDKINCAAEIVSDILKHKKADDLNISFNEDHINVLKEFNEHTRKAKEFIKNTEILSNLRNSAIFDHIDVPEEAENEYTGMAKEIVELIHEINK